MKFPIAIILSASLAAFFCGCENPPHVVKTYEITPAEKVVEYFDSAKPVVRAPYSELSDGTWKSGEYFYKYRLDVVGKMSSAKMNTKFIILSNIKDITFEQAWVASGLGDDSNAYFNPKIAVIVAIEIY